MSLPMPRPRASWMPATAASSSSTPPRTSSLPSAQPPEGGRSKGPRVVLVGDASGFPLSDLIAFLGQSRWTGTLRRPRPWRRALRRPQGRRGPRRQHREDPADRLGEVMVRLGYVARHDARGRAPRQPAQSRSAGRWSSRGCSRRTTSGSCVTHQVSESSTPSSWPARARSPWWTRSPTRRPAPAVQLSTQSLLMDAIRKIDELAHFRQRIPHGRVYVTKKRAQRRQARGGRGPGPGPRQRAAHGAGARPGLQAQRVRRHQGRLPPARGRLRLRLRADSTREVAAPGTAAAPAPRRGAEPVAAPAGRCATSTPSSGEIAAARWPSRALAREFLAAANAALTSRRLSESPVLVGLELRRGRTLPSPQGARRLRAGPARRWAASRSPRSGRRSRT